ncbi:hypothetical protein BH20CHL5_BH20CHL5_11340 [soil metagenome]|jgi:hypothetical protein
MATTPARPSRASLVLLGLLATISLSACSLTTMATDGAGERGGAGAPPDAGGGAPGDPGSGGAPSDTKPGAPAPDEPVTGGPAPDESPAGDGALHVEPVPGVVDSLPHAIDRVSVAADGRTATVYWWGGVDSCYGLDEVRVERDADGMPVITVLEGTLPGLGDVACIEIALSKATTITLDEPLYLDGSQG